MKYIEIIFWSSMVIILVYVFLKVYYDWAYTNGWCDAFQRATKFQEQINEAIRDHLNKQRNKKDNEAIL